MLTQVPSRVPLSSCSQLYTHCRILARNELDGLEVLKWSTFTPSMQGQPALAKYAQNLIIAKAAEFAALDLANATATDTRCKAICLESEDMEAKAVTIPMTRPSSTSPSTRT